MRYRLEPIFELSKPDGSRTQRLWRFPNDHGVSAVRAADARGSDGTTWAVAVVRFNGPELADFDLSYDDALTGAQKDVFCHVPDPAVEALVWLVARMDAGVAPDWT
jgi:hypothetical protein